LGIFILVNRLNNVAFFIFIRIVLELRWNPVHYTLPLRSVQEILCLCMACFIVDDGGGLGYYFMAFEN